MMIYWSRLVYKLLLTSLLAGIQFDVFAQGRVVEGRVTDAADNSPLPGVNVIVEGTAKGVATDFEGHYRIELLPGENALAFSFIGYQTVTEQVGERTVINVSLPGDVTSLEEVVVIGYGTVRKSDLTGSVSSIKSEELVKLPFASPTQALQGKMPGVQVISNSGEPGAGSTVRIRGTGTIGDASPLFIVDGMFLSNMDFLNPADIQSIEVLKDASATAIYGSRGANGVIIVTTKRGVVGKEAPTISFNADYSLQHLNQRIDLLNGKEFATVVNEITSGTFNNVDAVPNTDWQEQIFRDAPIHNYQVSVSGSSPRVQYYFGAGYYRQEGIIPKSNYERLTIKLNNTYHLTKFIRLGNNISVTPTRQQNAFGGAVFNAYRSQPTITPYQSDGTYSPVPGVGNVLADIEYTNSFGNGVASVGNFFLEVDFLKGFTFKSSLGYDAAYNKGRSFTPVYFVSTLQSNPINDLNKNYGDRFSWLWENTVNYNKEFGKHRLGAVIGYTAQESRSENFSIGSQNIIRDSEDFWFINANNILPNSVSNQPSFRDNFSIVSYLFRANYSFDSRYLLTFTYRRDGSSKFSTANRFSDFPAVAVGWNVINESFLENSEILSNLKVRGSWGIIGNEKIPYDRQYSRVLNGLSAVFGTAEALYPGSTYGVSGNPNLVWENSYQFDAGVEIGFMNEQFTAEIDYYKRNTKDILIDLTVPGYLGNGDGATITFNSGEVLNSGLEFNLGWNQEIGAFKYSINANGTTVHNEMLRISGNQGPGDYIQNGAGTTRTYVGTPIGSFYGYKAIGVFQNTADLNSYPHRSDAGVGDLKFEDVNGDGVLNGDDRTTLGSYIPNFYYGFNTAASYKAFDISIDFQGVAGNEILNNKETVRPDLYNFEQHVYDRWRGDGTSATEPRASSGGYNFLTSTRFIADGSFFRLRSLGLGYTLPAAVAGKAKMKTARVYLRGTNLFTWTKWGGYTPEVNSSSALDAGIDNGTYPIPSVYSVGLNVTF
jgi:TonB-linked SusC/RagA family outer membrane protein